MDNSHDFIIRNKPYTLVVFTVLTALGVLGAIAIIILTATSYIPDDVGWYFLFLPAFICSLSGFGIYVYIKEAFYLKDGVFTYVKAIKKTQSVKTEDISLVLFRSRGMFYKIEFYDKNGNVPLEFLDEGTALEGHRFINALIHFEINYKFI
ncbi:MAG: hypothetical protein K2L42_02735 [Clostridia bacterium]|nr:hypothetical protein [Clostridia bacterium]